MDTAKINTLLPLGVDTLQAENDPSTAFLLIGGGPDFEKNS